MLFLWLCFLSTICLANDYQLFDQNQHRMQAYDYLISRLKSGDVVHFSDGKSFTVAGVLGHGGTTMIFSLKDDPTKALRVPLNADGESYLSEFISSARDLEKNQIPAVRVEAALLGEYAVVDRVGEFMTFHQFVDVETRNQSPGLLDRFGWRSSTDIPTDEMKRNFVEFARHMAFFQVGDMHEGNIVYDFTNHRWILLDWTDFSDSRFFIAGQLHFEMASPFQELLRPYGLTSGLRFTARSSRYRWLQDMMDEASSAIRDKRGQASAVRFCSTIFFH
jgi:hypothetical protein